VWVPAHIKSRRKIVKEWHFAGIKGTEGTNRCTRCGNIIPEYSFDGTIRSRSQRSRERGGINLKLKQDS